MTTCTPDLHRIASGFPLRLDHSTWTQHIPFAMYVLSLVRPRLLVELGTYTGVSYCALCQAVHELQLGTSCFGIDTWAGDAHTGQYDDEVFESLHHYHEPLYGHFSRLVRSTFDDAARHFADASIDLLHIDGLHTYDAIWHDFDTWLPKMSNSGIMLIHDTSVREKDFGVWRFWDEVRIRYPHLEMRFGHGLGLLSVGSSPRKEVVALLATPADDLKQLEALFHQLGWRIELFQQVQDLSSKALEFESTAKRFHRIWSHRSVRAAYYWQTEGVRGLIRRALRTPGKDHTE